MPFKTRHFPLTFAFTLFALLLATGSSRASHISVAEQEAADGICHGHLIFCNDPEQMRMAGAYADVQLRSGHTYTIFYHYRNAMSDPGEFVVALQGSAGQRFRFVARQGLADPQSDPPLAGRQAMARFLTAPEKDYRGVGGARFAYELGRHQVASGVLSVCTESDARLRVYFRHDRWTVPGANTVVMDTPRRETAINLTATNGPQSFRIGEKEHGFDGAYGLMYAFHIQAPPGRRVRVSFSPRGGKGGLVGSLSGNLVQTGIVPATHWGVYCETNVGKEGVRLTTAPFGGVFYPVELIFRLL